MRVNLITGGMGFLGACVARALLSSGERVVLFQRSSELPAHLRDLQGRVEIAPGDMSNWVHVVQAVHQHHIESIFHLGALLSRDCEASPASCFSTNVVGTFNILEAARTLGVSDVVYSSTGYPCGLPASRRITDDTLLRPSGMYEASKFCSEQLGTQYAAKYGIQFRGLRVGMIIGVRRQLSYYFGDYSGLIEKAARGESYTVHVRLDVPQGIIYGKDVALALIALRDAPSGGLRQTVYNAHGFTATMQDIIDAVRRQMPAASITVDTDESEEMKTASFDNNYEMDNRSATEDFGWRPRYDLERSVADMIRDVRAEQR